MTRDDVVSWLMEGDPAIRWQTMRDLLDWPTAEYETGRARVAAEGWGARLLTEQDAKGRWGGGLYNPKWVSTHYTLLLLRSMGLRPSNGQALRGAVLLLDGGMRPDGGIHYSRTAKNGETCVTGMTLAIAAYFRLQDERIHGLVEHLLRVQLPDGGWNCRWVDGSKHGSFHTTISVLEGLMEYERMYPERASIVAKAQEAGREFFLQHRLFKSHRTGAVADPAMTRFSFPPHWHYDVLRGLDYLQAVDADRDQRLGDAIDLVRRRCQPDGRWLLQNRHGNRLWFEMEQVGQPSRWNTLRALRILGWWGSP